MIGIGWGKMVDGARDDSIGRTGEGRRWCAWSVQGGGRGSICLFLIWDEGEHGS